MCVHVIVMALVLAINDPPSVHQTNNHRRILIACIYGDFAIADFQTAHACVQQLFVFIVAHELNDLLLFFGITTVNIYFILSVSFIFFESLEAVRL